MPIAFVQAPAGAQMVSGTSLSTAAITTTSGNLVVIGVTYVASFSSVSDSKGNTWTLAAGPVTASAGDTIRCYYAFNLTGGAGHTFTLNLSAAGAGVVCAAEYSGVLLTDPLDQTATQASSGNPVDSSSTATTTQADELLIGYGQQSSGVNLAWSAGASYTLRANVADAVPSSIGAMVERLVSATGAYNATMSHGGETGTYSALIATFKAAGWGALRSRSRNRLIGVR